jgi:uncharacterized membrane protein (DUF4010 family)
MEAHLDLIWKLGAALGVGLLIGIERGWHGRKEDEGDRIAGIRTFSLSGLLGGIWAVLIPYTGEWILGLVFIAFTGLLIASYVFEQKSLDEQDIGITTEVSLLLTYSLGAWAALGYQIESLASAVVVMSILSVKPVLHSWLREIDVEVIYAGIKLLIISVILLPVVLISGLSFLGYILVKYVGQDKGTLLTSVIGGLASSTAVTISFARFAEQQKIAMSKLFAAGVLIASSIMFIRVYIEIAVVNPALLHPIWIPLTVMLVLTFVCVFWLWKKSSQTSETSDNPTLDLGNPLQLGTALQFGFLLAVILVLATALEEWLGNRGIYLLALISGLMDVDAITVSFSKMAQNDLNSVVAIRGIILAVISNTLVKAGLFMFLAGWKKSVQLLWLISLIAAGGITSVLLFV